MRSISSRRLAEIGDDHLSDVPDLVREIRKRHRKVENDLRSARACIDMVEDARPSDQSQDPTNQEAHTLYELQTLLQEEEEWLGRRSDISTQDDEEWQSLRAEFDRLRQSDRVWDLTREDVGKQYRSLATRGVDRRQTRLSVDTLSDLSRTQKACRFKNANGPDIWLFPHVLVIDTDAKGIALVEWSNVNIEIYSTGFHEDETVPNDAEVVDHTWKYTNNDGSRDRRFNNNYRIPICHYSIIRLGTDSGLEEEFMFSNADKTHSFASSLEEYLSTEKSFPIDFYQEAIEPSSEVQERRSKINTLRPVLREYQRQRKRKTYARVAFVALILVGLAAGLIYAATSGSPMGDANSTSPPPPRINATPNQVVGDSNAYSLTVVAKDDKLSPIRATVDGGVRRPYWVEKGEAVRFFWSERIILEGNLGATKIGLNNYLYRLPPEATQRAVFTDSTATSFTDSF